MAPRSNFRPEAAQLAETGTTQPEIAEALGCTNRTLSRWALQYPEFRAALDRGLARREAERRAAEMAPLRAKAATLLQLIAKAIGEAASTPDDGASVPVAPRQPETPQNPVSAPSELPRLPRAVARYAPPEPEPDAFDGEAWPLDDPRAGW